MKLVVGLGNPGRRYADTRHNVGFRVIEELAQRYGAGGARRRFHGELTEVTREGTRILLLRPQTYMNRCGLSVLEARDYFRIDNADLLVVCDDFNLPLAKLRVRAKGSSGGQKGLEDIIRCLGTEHFPRLRIGIGPPPAGCDVAEYVLSRFGSDEVSAVQAAIARAADAAAMWAVEGIESCMNHYNAAGD